MLRSCDAPFACMAVVPKVYGNSIRPNLPLRPSSDLTLSIPLFSPPTSSFHPYKELTV